MAGCCKALHSAFRRVGVCHSAARQLYKYSGILRLLKHPHAFAENHDLRKTSDNPSVGRALHGLTVRVPFQLQKLQCYCHCLTVNLTVAVGSSSSIYDFH
eukprot:1194265-Prorocentrum_minimum.AAC.6